MPWFVASCVCCRRRLRIKSQGGNAMLAAPPAIAPLLVSELELELFYIDIGVDLASVGVIGKVDSPSFSS